MTLPPPIDCRYAAVADAPLLARMNQQLIRDERHRNPMTLEELEHRMRHWLRGEYRAVVVELDGQPIGYALYREEPDHVYLRQFFIASEHRRCGLGRSTMRWLREHAWPNRRRIRLDVLVGNAAAIEFWRSVGFRDYCITMEFKQE